MMIESLKKLYRLHVQRRWLKTIEKECDRYNKLKSKLSRQQYVINKLLEQYKEIYGDPLSKSDTKEAN